MATSVLSWQPAAMGFLLVLFRCGGLMMTAPLFGTRTVPTRVRMAISLVVAMVAFQAAGLPRFAAWDRLSAILPAIVTESLIGLGAGMAARFSIDAAASAGQTISLSMGLGFSAVIDPLHGADSTSLSELLTFVTLGVCVAAGLHREAIAWFCRSIIETPPGTAMSVPELTTIVIGEAARAVALSIRLAFPVMAAVLFGYAGMGVLGRTAPQLNLSNVGFAIALLCGGGALYLMSPTIAELVARSARTVFVGG